MFCYQRTFCLPTEVVTQQLFRQLVDSPKSRWLTQEHRRWRDAMPSIVADEKLQEEWARDEEFQKFCINEVLRLRRMRGGTKKAKAFESLPLVKKMQAYCDSLKKALPFVIFIATFAETPSTKGQKMGAWRKQAACRLNGLCVIDFDHIDSDTQPHPLTPSPNGEGGACGGESLTPDPSPKGEKSLTPNPSPRGEGSQKTVREIWEEAYNKLSEEDKKRILLVFVTPSGHGLKVVFIADEKGNLIDNQREFSQKLGLNPDESCKDASRGAFLTTSDDILFLDESRLFTYENADYGKKYNEAYHQGMSQPTIQSEESKMKGGECAAAQDCSQLEYNGVPYARIIEAWMEGRNLTNKRHDTLVELSDRLRYIIGKNPTKITEVVMTLPWVQDLAAEGEDVAGTVGSIMGWRYRQKKPDDLLKALEKAAAITPRQAPPSVGGVGGGSSSAGTGWDEALPFDTWAEELTEMAEYYPCLKELFLNVHPHKLPAVWFSAAAMFGTLMTRSWYHFWYEPERTRRLNYCIFIIGDPGAGKNVIEKFYFKICDPMIQADQGLIDAVNRYKDGRTERSTSTKAQKEEALKKPVVGIRVHPARTSTGEFIRHMLAAVATVQGKPMNLHMFSFDAELDNVTRQNKGGDYKDREILEIKSFHNENDGQFYANAESITATFDVFWNFVYTGTPYALHRKVNQRNFGTGLSTRLAVIPLPDKGIAKRNQSVMDSLDETLRTWSYRLDKVEGELPITLLNDETYEWQSSRLEIADFNGDKADRTLLKRIPYYGISISLPFILMRHWDEWQEHKTLTIDDRDCRLCRLAMEIQYRCQQFFFGEMAFNYFADQNKEFAHRHRTTRYEECFRKLPDEFKSQQFMECFSCSQPAASKAITRFQNEGIVEKVKYGLYRKRVNELPHL